MLHCCHLIVHHLCTQLWMMQFWIAALTGLVSLPLYQQQVMKPSCNLLLSTLWGNLETVTQVPGISLASKLPKWSIPGKIRWNIIINFTLTIVVKHEEESYYLCRQADRGYPLHCICLLFTKYLHVLQLKCSEGKKRNVFPKQSGAFKLTFLSNCCLLFSF